MAVPVLEETALPIVPEAEEAEPETESVRLLTMDAGQISVFETQDVLDGYTLSSRCYTFPNGDVLTMGRAQTRGGRMELHTWTEDGDGAVRYYDKEAAQWVERPFSDCVLQTSMVELELESGGSCLIYLPKTYVCQENASLEYLPEQDGTLQITEEADQWTFALWGTAPEEESVCDYTMVRSDGALLDWSHPGCEALWSGYTMTGSGKWCFDGYYWPSPENYAPSGEHYLYRCPASYLVKSFAYVASVHRAAEDLAVAMLDTLSQVQNEYGFWETSPESGWLSGSYGIGAGFYDTRFNTDLIEIYVLVYERLGGDFLCETMGRYADFYLSFAETHHFETENGGWLVQDYFHPDGNEPTHCSLNHQAAECIALYHLSGALEREDLAQTAGSLLQAVKDTAHYWINGDGDLHYSVQPDGTYGGQDYPYLTYNDLYTLQALLLEKTGSEDADIAFLMEAKRIWMDRNGVTEYKK